MPASEIARDSTVALAALAVPSRGLSAVVERRRAAFALALATAASLAAAAVILPRIDFASAAKPDVKPGEEATPAQLEEATITATKVGQVGGYLGAALLPSLLAVGAAGALFAGFRVAGTRPGFKETLAVTAHGMLPVWLSGLLALPAAVTRAPLRPEEAAAILPSNLAALLPPGASPALAAALSSVDLFALWGVALVALGMARAAGASRLRALSVTGVLFASYVALLKVAPAAAAAAMAAAGPQPH
jgi:hypothetical protein